MSGVMGCFTVVCLPVAIIQTLLDQTQIKNLDTNLLFYFSSNLIEIRWMSLLSVFSSERCGIF